MQEYAFSDTDTFSHENGFNVAIALTNWDDNTESILDPTFGDFEINSYEWGVRENGTPYMDRSRLETHQCTREELGLEDSSG